jgi:L-ascorbate metabolism protein UlaG (beta-lactamase superfamily)
MINRTNLKKRLAACRPFTRAGFKKICAVLFLTVVLVLISCSCSPKFMGRLPRGEHKERIRQSPNYRDGRFQNINDTKFLTDGVWATLTQSRRNLSPKNEIPVVRTNFFALDPQENLMVWFGHFSVYFQLEGKRFLVDPALSGSGSPVSFINRAFKGTDVFKPADIPDIDYLVITHDHYDHLDYRTVRELRPRVSKVVVPLGVGAHFLRWGYAASDIIEMDWNNAAQLDGGLEIYCFPARHQSARGLRRSQTLWASFLVKSESLTIFISGDTGYDTHFASIGERFGSIDFALLENGQYNTSWKYVHLFPEEVLQAGIDLRARYIFPIHHSKFTISSHTWDEPLRRITAANEKLENPQQIITPKIGEVIFLNDTTQTFTKWWEGVE